MAVRHPVKKSSEMLSDHYRSRFSLWGKINCAAIPVQILKQQQTEYQLKPYQPENNTY